MSNTILIYGSDTHNTQDVAELIAAYWGDDLPLKDISRTKPEEFAAYSHLILGIPTWYDGELQSDWYDFFPKLDSINLTGKTVAIFGLGDQAGYPYTFLDAMGELYEKVLEQGAEVVGQWPLDDYDFEASRAQLGDQLVGLGLDYENQDDLTPIRVEQWVEILKKAGF